jgi:uncharacterized protein YqeY
MENTYTHVAETLHLARKNGDKFAVTVLSTLLGEMQNKIPKDATPEQQHTQATAIVKKFIEGVNENLAHRGSDHPALFRELAILEAFMPMQLKDAELKDIVATIVADVGKNKGAIMKALKTSYPNMYDGKKAAGIVDAAIA